MKKQMILIHWTCGNLEEARKLARLLVKRRLVACANIIPWVESVFLWKESLETMQETKVIFKTTEEKFESVKNILLENAQYELPEILKVTISGGHEAYLKWVEETVEPREIASLA